MQPRAARRLEGLNRLNRSNQKGKAFTVYFRSIAEMRDVATALHALVAGRFR